MARGLTSANFLPPDIEIKRLTNSPDRLLSFPIYFFSCR